MNAAERATQRVIESTLGDNPAYRKLDEHLYIVKQGSTFVMINVVAIGDDRAQVRCVAQLVKGVRIGAELAIDLLTMNTRLRFGAFGYEPNGELVVLIHSILGGATLDAAELLATVSDLALLADEYDDKICSAHGGQTMKDLLEQAAFERIVGSLDIDAFGQGRN
jgi:hypothetical protein